LKSRRSINTKFAVRLQVHKWTSWVVQNCHIQIQSGGRRHFEFFHKTQ